MFKYIYKTPKGFDDMIMTGDNECLTALCFMNSPDISKINPHCGEKITPVFIDTIRWLDIYFSGKTPGFTPKYALNNISPFRRRVTDIMNKIPYGKTTSYGDIAHELTYGKKKMSAQAVGGAVGANPICIIVPCHRVVGKNGRLVGYGGGMQNKIKLLELEGLEIENERLKKIK